MLSNVWQVQIVGFFDPLLWANNHPCMARGNQIQQKLGILGKKSLLHKKMFLNLITSFKIYVKNHPELVLPWGEL